MLAILPMVAAAQSGTTPDYIDSMSAFEVRRLDGPYSPSNGNISMESVTPNEWLNNDPSVLGLAGVIVAWNGGAKGRGSKLFVHGGGHSDSANNGMYIYDFNGAANPTGWQAPLVISAVADVRADQDTYADGKPNAVHTYDGIVYASHNDHVYRFGGSPYISGGFTDAAFKYNVATGQWTRLPNYPGGASGDKTIYDPVSGKIFVTMTAVNEGHFLRTNNDTWSGAKNYSGNGFPFNSMVAWDTKRNRGIVVGQGETSLITVDFSAETVSVQSFNPSGDTQLFPESGISALYDPAGDVYWLFGGDTGSLGWTNIYEMPAAGNAWPVTRRSLSGAAIARSGGMIGSWGRYILMPQWRAIGLVASETSAAFVVKLPSGQITTPESPADLRAN